MLAYFPHVACDVFPLGSLYETSARISIYSGHVRQIVEHCVVSVFGVSRADLYSQRRNRAQVVLARQTAMYLAHVACGLTMTQVGELFRRDRTTVAHGCGAVEDLRDDPVMDRALSILEAVLLSLACAKNDGGA